MMTAEHVAHKKIVQPIAVNIGEIDSHRIMTGAANGKLRQSAEVAMPVIDPDSIRGLKIVAHIDVRKAVAIEVVEHDREAQIPRRAFERFALLSQKRPIRPRHWRENSLAVIEVKHVRLAQFDQQAIDNLQPSALPAGDLRLAIDVADGNRSAASQNSVLPIIGYVEIERAVAVDVRQRHRVAPRL